jgi:hypothetical protein
VRKTSQERAWRQQFHPRRGQLEGQRQAIESPANVSDGYRIVLGQRHVGLNRRGPLHKECHRRIVGHLVENPETVRGGQGERSQRKLVLSPYMEGFPTGGKHGEPGTGCQEPDDLRRGREDLLAVVQDEQESLRGQERGERGDESPPKHLPDAERGGQGGHYQASIGEGREIDEDHPVGKGLVQPAGDRDRQPRLAHPPGAGESQQPDSIVLQGGSQRRELRLAPNEPSQWHRQRDGTGSRPHRAIILPHGGARRSQQRRPLVIRKRQAVRKQAHGLQSGSRVQSALQVADAAPAEPGAFGQFLLGKRRRGAQLTKQAAERGVAFIHCCPAWCYALADSGRVVDLSLQSSRGIGSCRRRNCSPYVRNPCTLCLVPPWDEEHAGSMPGQGR